MLNFCTLFDSNYLTRGLSMYQSLQENCKDFHLYIFAFDDICCQILTDMKLCNTTIISLNQFESPELLGIKPTRNIAEYCWTCTPSTVDYCLETYGLDHCIYIDADIFFFSDPKVLLEEMQDNSVLITEHRYSRRHEHLSTTSGIYNVQFVVFKNDEYGRKVLKWWKERCIEWCFARVEDGKFGDQKYLDDWPERFKKVHVLKNFGGGIAPWNVDQYEFHFANGKIFGKKLDDGDTFQVIFFHFHDLKYFSNGTILLSGPLYDISESTIQLLYKPYITEMEMQNRFLKTEYKNLFTERYINKSKLIFKKPYWKIPLRIGYNFLFLLFKGRNKNVYKLSTIINK